MQCPIFQGLMSAKPEGDRREIAEPLGIFEGSRALCSTRHISAVILFPTQNFLALGQPVLSQ
jgi:hypothetical protein